LHREPVYDDNEDTAIGDESIFINHNIKTLGGSEFTVHYAIKCKEIERDHLDDVVVVISKIKL
jgi:hypothetical protein